MQNCVMMLNKLQFHYTRLPALLISMLFYERSYVLYLAPILNSLTRFRQVSRSKFLHSKSYQVTRKPFFILNVLFKGHTKYSAFFKWLRGKCKYNEKQHQLFIDFKIA
jgi:hypothetical protein